ncbi:MAG: insulinase family protein [Magnetococcales bacterium]|nr:insulinase family protein [Magnetococcales bacterium]
MSARCGRWLLVVWLCVWGGQAGAVPVQRFVMPGGTQVVLIESHVNPMVEVRILARGGSAYDPSGKEGVAAMTAWMFNEGGGELDSTAFQERLRFFGINLSAAATQDTMEVSMTTLSEHLDPAWAMLADAMLRPRADPEDLQRGLRERVAELIKGEEDADFRITRLFYPLLYGSHPYAHPVTGTVESVKTITIDDITRHHAGLFHAPGLVVSVAGDVTLERLQSLMTRHFEGLKPEPGPFLPLPLADSPEAGQTRHIEMDLPQTTLRVGWVGINRDDPDFYAMTVMNQILGGGGLPSRLTTVIREERGLTYGIFSYFSLLAARGPFVVGTDTKTASASEVLSLIHEQLRRIVEEPVGEGELRDVKRYLTGSFFLHLDGLDKLAETWSRIVFYQRGMDYLDKWPERIRAVTPEDIRRLAGRIVNFRQLHTVSAGKHAPQQAGGDNPLQRQTSPPSP